MSLLNYTTVITVHKTTGEIQETLAKAGAHMIIIEYGEDHIPEAVSFQIKIEQGRYANFRLPSRWEGVWKVLCGESIPNKYKTKEQARRVAWRIIKDWVEAQVAIIEAGSAELSEVFLPYLINPQTQHTLFEDFKSGYLLPPGENNIIDGEVREKWMNTE